jgi:hypothetical protein
VSVIARLAAFGTRVRSQYRAFVLAERVFDVVRPVDLLGLTIILAKVT